MATININIRKEDVLNINVIGTQQVNETNSSKEDIDALFKKLNADLSKYNHNRNKQEHKFWWYEVFIDFDEDFEEYIYPHIKNMGYEEQYTFCLGYMYRRDEYYGSPAYYEFLDKLAECVYKEK